VQVRNGYNYLRPWSLETVQATSTQSVLSIYYIQKGFFELTIHDCAWMVLHVRSAWICLEASRRNSAWRLITRSRRLATKLLVQRVLDSLRCATTSQRHGSLAIRPPWWDQGFFVPLKINQKCSRQWRLWTLGTSIHHFKISWGWLFRSAQYLVQQWCAPIEELGF
jgi:hypothetical protein